MNTLLADKTNYRAGRLAGIRFIVIHYTAGNGDTAYNNCRYFQGANRGAGAHYFVDESEVWQSVPDADTAWHCGAFAYRHPECRNANSIGIEMCSRIEYGEYVIPARTQDRAAELVRELMGKYHIPADHVLRHYDVTGKACPEPFVREPEQWTAFLDKIKEDDMTEADVRRIVAEVLRGDGTSVSATLKPEFDAAVKKGVTDGTRPGGYATRAQVAVMIERATK